MEEFIEQDLSNRHVNAGLMSGAFRTHLQSGIFSARPKSPTMAEHMLPSQRTKQFCGDTHKHPVTAGFLLRIAHYYGTLVHRSMARACRHLGGEVPVEEALAVQVPESLADVQR